ncbi:MAG: hypothetical protein QW231_00195 [Candidatus Bathyarchaeia archaeon]
MGRLIYDREFMHDGNTVYNAVIYVRYMASETYKRFLESQAEKNPVKLDRRTMSWEEQDVRLPLGSPSSLLESLYLGREPEETVVVDRKSARLLQERLSGLETEVNQLHKRIRRMRVATWVLLGITAMLSLFIYLLLQGVPFWHLFR